MSHRKSNPSPVPSPTSFLSGLSRPRSTASFPELGSSAWEIPHAPTALVETSISGTDLYHLHECGYTTKHVRWLMGPPSEKIIPTKDTLNKRRLRATIDITKQRFVMLRNDLGDPGFAGKPDGDLADGPCSTDEILSNDVPKKLRKPVSALQQKSGIVIKLKLKSKPNPTESKAASKKKAKPIEEEDATDEEEWNVTPIRQFASSPTESLCKNPQELPAQPAPTTGPSPPVLKSPARLLKRRMSTIEESPAAVASPNLQPLSQNKRLKLTFTTKEKSTLNEVADLAPVLTTMLPPSLEAPATPEDSVITIAPEVNYREQSLTPPHTESGVSVPLEKAKTPNVVLPVSNATQAPRQKTIREMLVHEVYAHVVNEYEPFGTKTPAMRELALRIKWMNLCGIDEIRFLMKVMDTAVKLRLVSKEDADEFGVYELALMVSQFKPEPMPPNFPLPDP